MSQSSETAAPTWAAPAALVAGIASVLLLILNFVALSGMAVLVVSMIAGVLAVVFGIVAVKARVSKGAAIAGMVTGGIGFLFSATIIVFALLFIGALGV